MQFSGAFSSEPAMNSKHLWIQQKSQHTSEIGHMADENSLPAANGRMLNTAKRTRFRYPILSNNDTINTESNETCRGRRTLRKKKERKKKKSTDMKSHEVKYQTGYR